MEPTIHAQDSNSVLNTEYIDSLQQTIRPCKI